MFPVKVACVRLRTVYHGLPLSPDAVIDDGIWAVRWLRPWVCASLVYMLHDFPHVCFRWPSDRISCATGFASDGQRPRLGCDPYRVIRHATFGAY